MHTVAERKLFRDSFTEKPVIREITHVGEKLSGTEGEQPLVCALCTFIITANRHRTIVNGASEHIFTNPHGAVFHIGCFAKADGCLSLGISSYDYTWFKGYSWDITICRNCGAHLGWLYRNDSGNAFFGLILDRLRQT